MRVTRRPYKDIVQVATSFAGDALRTLRADNWVNVITGLGGRRDRSKGAVITDFARLTVWQLDALYHGQDLPAAIVDKLPQDAFRLGIETGDPAVDAALVRWDALDQLEMAVTWGRLYGWGAVFLGFSDKLGPMDSPVDLAKVGPGDLKFLMVLDRQDVSIMDRVRDPESPDYGDARYYSVTPSADETGTFGGTRVHASRMIVFGGARTSERQKLRNDGFDLSVLQRPIDVLRDVDQTWRSVMSLLQDMSQAVFKIQGLMDMIANGQKDTVLQRMEIVDMARSVARAVVIDADGEDFAHVGAANVTGVDPLLVRVFTRLAAAADMPLTVLMGISPAGLNATGESDIRLWYGRVQAQRTRITPQVRRLVRVIARSEGLDPPESITWPSLWAMTPTEEVAYQKSLADVDTARIANGTLLPEEATLIWTTGASPADVIGMRAAAAPALGAEGAAVTTDDTTPRDIEPGSLWTDTEDGHRLEITDVIGEDVYFLDLDSDRPTRQWRWRRSAFLERSRRAA